MSVTTIDEGDVPTTLARLPGRIGQPSLSLSLSFSLLSFFSSFSSIHLAVAH
jgi:hypothetical protein